MSSESEAGGRRPPPPKATQFRKGQSGNPAGRPRKVRELEGSAFGMLMDRSFTIKDRGQDRVVSIEEALQHKLYQEGLKGKPGAVRAVLKMIAKREKEIAKRNPVDHNIPVVFEGDPHNADLALLALGIATAEHVDGPAHRDGRRLRLEPWAVQLALNRRPRREISDEDMRLINNTVRDAHTVDWRKGWRL